jgi:hypothetical protein
VEGGWYKKSIINMSKWQEYKSTKREKMFFTRCTKYTPCRLIVFSVIKLKHLKCTHFSKISSGTLSNNGIMDDHCVHVFTASSWKIISKSSLQHLYMMKTIFLFYLLLVHTYIYHYTSVIVSINKYYILLNV